MLIGHTANDADSLYNMALSKRRIAAVRNYLKREGINVEAVNEIPNGEKI